MKRITLLALALGVLAAAAAAQQTQVIVTALPDHGNTLPAIVADQVKVQQGHDTDPVANWQACAGGNCKLEVALMIDDDTKGLNTSMGDLKSFIENLPPTTYIALIYMNAGTVQILHTPTLDHKLVASMLRAPAGSSPSPYGSLEALLAHWHSHPGVRHEIIMISDGEEHAGGNNSNNNTVKEAIADAVSSGVVVYGIFAGQGAGPHPQAAVDPDPSGSGTTATNPFGDADNMTSGSFGTAFGHKQNAVVTSERGAANGMQSFGDLTKATGGALYSSGDGKTPSRLSPFLDQIEQRLQSQYLLDFTAAPGKGMQNLKVEVSGTNAKITAPDAVVPPKQ